MSELLNNLKDRKDFKVTFDGDDFGIYKYNKEKDRYEGFIGHMTITEMVEIIKDKESFIKLEVANEIN